MIALRFLCFFLLLIPFCYSFLGLTAYSPKAHLSPSESLNRRVDESLAYLSFGLRSTLLPFPTHHIPRRHYEPSVSSPPTPVVIHEEPLLSSSAPLAPSSFPWTKSITPSREVVYMPILADQLKIIQQLKMVEIPLSDNFSLKQSTVKPARIHNSCFQNEKFRKVRMTYFDAGDNVQVFNTLWYPHFQYDLPMLGVDLISLGKNRVLTVVDYQPLHPTREYFEKYISHLTPIRQKYPDLQGTLSGKIYNDTSFFSANMLFGRFSDETKIDSVVQPAFQEYLSEYLKLMDSATPNYSPESMESVKQRQTAYDIYSALKDPAVGLFNSYFGKEWSDDFVHNFLFSFSKITDEPDKPVHQFQFDANGAIHSVSSVNVSHANGHSNNHSS